MILKDFFQTFQSTSRVCGNIQLKKTPYQHFINSSPDIKLFAVYFKSLKQFPDDFNLR